MTVQRDVCVVADSVGDIPRNLVEELGIIVVPLSFVIEGETFVDGELTMTEFLQRMDASSELPQTSQPSVGAFVEAFEEGLSRCKEVVCITISNRLSGTFESAMEAARKVGDHVHVLDTLNLSFGEGYQALTAARAAFAGESLEGVKQAFERAHRNIHMLVGLDSLKNIAKGGRIGRVSAFLGGVLNMRVSLTVGDDGMFIPVARVRGEKAALEATVNWLAERVSTTKRAEFAVMHCGSPEKAAWLESAVRSRFNVAELLVIEVGPVIATHTGRGWGVSGAELE